MFHLCRHSCACSRLSCQRSNAKINYNTFRNGHRFAIGQQGSNAAGLEIACNSVTKPLNPWALTYGLFIVPDGSTGVFVHEIYLNANLPVARACTGSGCHYGYGIESSGHGTQVYNNIVEGNWINGGAVGRSTNLKVPQQHALRPGDGEGRLCGVRRLCGLPRHHHRQ